MIASGYLVHRASVPTPHPQKNSHNLLPPSTLPYVFKCREVRINNLNFLYYIVAPKTAVVRDETLTIYDSPNVNVFLIEQQVTVGAAPTSEDSVVLHMDLTLRFRVQGMEVGRGQKGGG